MTDHTRAMLDEAWEAIHRGGYPPEWLAFINRRNHFTRLLDAEAYLDAAVMLVPEGWEYAIGTGRAQHMTENGRKPWAWVARSENFELPQSFHMAPTPALALLAAIMKAKNDE